MCIGISLYTTLSNTCTDENIGFCLLITSKLQKLKKRATKTCKVFCNITAKQVEKAMLRVYRLTSNLFCNKSACCNLIEYCPLIGWDYPWVAPYMVVKSLVAKQVCVGPVKCKHLQILSQKEKTSPYFLQQLFAPCINLICCKTGLIRGW